MAQTPPECARLRYEFPGKPRLGILIYEPLVRITREFLLMLNGLRGLTSGGNSDLIYEPAVRIFMQSLVDYE